MEKTLKFGNVLTCEHVVSGAMGKPTLIGVYAGDILVKSLPASITMGIYAEHIPDESQFGKLTLTLMLGNKVIGIIAAETDGTNSLGVIAVPLVSLKITENTKFKVVASCEGFKSKTIIDQKISEGVKVSNSSPSA